MSNAVWDNECPWRHGNDYAHKLLVLHVVAGVDKCTYEVKFVRYADNAALVQEQVLDTICTGSQFVDADTLEPFDDPALVKDMWQAWLAYLYVVRDSAAKTTALMNTLPDWKEKRIRYWLYNQ